MKTILVLETDIELNYRISYALKTANHQVVSAYSVDEGELAYRQAEIDLAIIDVDLANETGFAFYEWLYQQHTLPGLFLTTQPVSEKQLKEYNLEAEDYLEKPFVMATLLEKVDSILLRETNSDWHVFDDGFLVINFDSAEVTVGGADCRVTPTEFRLLKYLIGHKGQLLSYELLLTFLRDTGAQFDDKHALAVNINRLRKKIEDQSHRYIVNVFGKGYFWKK